MGKKPANKNVPVENSPSKPVIKRLYVEMLKEISNAHSLPPSWAFNYAYSGNEVDSSNPFCPIKYIQENLGIFDSLIEKEKITIQKIKEGEKQGSHYIPPKNYKKICKEARDWIANRSYDDLADRLFTMRLSGKMRIWGFLIGNVFHVIWADPNHKVYPTKLKNT